jgi:hypothetical protein
MDKPDETNIIMFYPKFLTVEGGEPARDALIEKYRAWLDQHGDYGRLYMMHQGKMSRLQPSLIMGVRIFDSEIAVLFRLMFEL